MHRKSLIVALVITAALLASAIPVLVSAGSSLPLAFIGVAQSDITPVQPGQYPDDLGILPSGPIQIIQPTATPVDDSGIAIMPAPSPAAGQSAAVDDLGILPAFGSDRLTILLLGTDMRPSEASAAYTRTDTILLISLDPSTNQIGVLSIPRDLYVQIPGYGFQRINTAFTFGETWQPGYGPQLLKDTITTNFGMSVDHYALLDFSTFERVIDLVGGVDLTVEEAIADPWYPDESFGYDPFYLDAGEHHLDGATALKYVRTRHNSDDRVRMRRQQQVIMAVIDKLASPQMFTTMLRQLPDLWDEFQQGVQTDMTLAQVMDLALLARTLTPERINGDVMDFRYCTPAIIGDQSVLVPNTASIPGLMVELFGSTYYQ